MIVKVHSFKYMENEKIQYDIILNVCMHFEITILSENTPKAFQVYTNVS